MSVQLPDFDETASFVVDRGEPVGPTSLRAIVDSISSGQRPPEALIWWEGLPDWLPASHIPELMVFLAQKLESRRPEDTLPTRPTAEDPLPDPTPARTVEPEPALLPSNDPVEAPTSEPAVHERALTGLFSAANRSGGASGQPVEPRPDIVERVLSARTSLESISRVEALAIATREASLAVALAGQISEGRTIGARVGTEDAPLQSPEDGDPIAALASPRSRPETSTDRELELHFEEMVRRSQAHQRRLEEGARLDEVILSACVGAITDAGFVAYDLSSRDGEHSAKFDCEDGRLLHLELESLSREGTPGAGHVRIELAWGSEVDDIDGAFAIVRTMASAEFSQPGEIGALIDVDASKVFTNVHLIWAVSDFAGRDYTVDNGEVQRAVAASLHKLEAQWERLFSDR